MMGNTFTDESVYRIARAVHRVERMRVDKETDGGGDWDVMPAPVLIEVRIIDKVTQPQNRTAGSGQTFSPAILGVLSPPVDIDVVPEVDVQLGSGGGGGSGSGSGSGCDLNLWNGQALVWNGCTWDDNGEVYVFREGGDLTAGQVKTLLLDSHFQPYQGADERPLCQVIGTSGARRRITVVTGVCLTTATGSTGSG